MIIKVQISVLSSAERVLIYDKHRRFTYEGEATPEIKELLAGRPKAFFHAMIDDQKRFEIDGEALWQEW